MTSRSGRSAAARARRTPLVPTYFSHSYRVEDRAVNEAFHQRLWTAGFALMVDPQSEQPTITQLEMMMCRSAAFVAVAPYRSDVEHYRTSAFVVYEYGLAVQAGVPALVFAETQVSGAAFAAEDLVVFDRPSLKQLLEEEEVRSRLTSLADRSRPRAAVGRRASGAVGLLLPRNRAYREARTVIVDILERGGYEPEDVADHPDSYRLMLDLGRYDFVVTDLGAGQAEVRALDTQLYGKLVPTVKLHHRSPGDAAPPVEPIHSRALETRRKEMSPLVPWTTPDELAERLLNQVATLQHLRRPFVTRDEGIGYFRSLGRASSGPVFISNAGEDNELARAVTRSLELANVNVFHYVYRNSIEKGVDFEGPLLAAVEASTLFVPLLSNAYVDSPWCRREYDHATHLRARGGPTVVPYLLEDLRDDHGLEIAPQGASLFGQSLRAQSTRIVRDVDAFLSERAVVVGTPRTRTGPRMTETVDSLRGTVDVAVVTVLRVEYDAVRAVLADPAGVGGSPEHPDRYAWEVGRVASTRYRGEYTVVLAIAPGAGTSSGLLAVLNTVRAFQPRYALLVGVAGGLADDLRLGDVVVSTRIFGYEYGKVDDGRFHPRPDWLHQTDSAVSNAANVLATRSPDWYAAVPGLPDRADPKVKVEVGPIASGNKVVDDPTAESFSPVLELWGDKLIAVEMEGLGAAEAAAELTASGPPVNFAMVRGISDLPGRAAANGRIGVSAQTAQRDSNKPLAAATAAACALHLLRDAWPIPPVTDER